MTLEEKAEEYATENDICVCDEEYWSHDDLVKAYIAGAKELEQENTELKDKLNKIERKCKFNFVDLLHDVENESKQEEQIEQAKKIIKDLMHTPTGCVAYYEVYKQAEQFLKE